MCKIVGSCVAQGAQLGALLGDLHGVGKGRETPEGGDICMHVADSLCCMQKLTQHCNYTPV